MITEVMLNIAVVLAAIVALAALGLWMFSEMFAADEQPEPTGQDNTPKAPPEPEH